MSSELHLRRDYNTYSAFVAAAKEYYPTKKVDEAIKACSTTVWKVSKSIFTLNPNAKFFAHLAEALEKAIISS